MFAAQFNQSKEGLRSQNEIYKFKSYTQLEVNFQLYFRSKYVKGKKNKIVKSIQFRIRGQPKSTTGKYTLDQESRDRNQLSEISK